MWSYSLDLRGIKLTVVKVRIIGALIIGKML